MGLVPPTQVRADRYLLYTAVVLVPVVLILLVWCALLPTDPDYWWHVRTGQLIADLHTVPTADPFSYTATGNAWNDHEWLTELGMYALQQHIGYVANVVLFGAIMASTAVVMFLTCRRWGMGELGSVAIVVWAFGMSLPSAGVRPQSVTRLLIAVVALIVTLYIQTGRGRWLWLLPLVFALWSNLHGGFVIGLGLLGLAVIGQSVLRVAGRSGASPLPLVFVTLACVAASLINPQGVDALLYPLPYLKGNSSLAFISEWQTPDLRQPAFFPFAASILLALGLGFSRRPLAPTHVLWALVFALLGLQSIRNISLFATIGMPLIGARLAAEVPAFRRTIARWQRPGRMVFVWVVGLTAAVGLWCASEVGNGVPLQLGSAPVAADYPVGAVDYLQAQHLEGNLFNQYEWGGYVIDRLYPEYHVFMDGRPDVYGDALVEQYVAIDGLRPGWQDALAQYDVRIVLVRRDGMLASALASEPGWQELYTGPVERLYIRTSNAA